MKPDTMKYETADERSPGSPVRTLANIAVNPIGLGCMGLSEFYGATDEGAASALLEHALASGVNHFDTADSYGFGRNEILLGHFLARHAPRREHIVLASKCGIVRNPDVAGRRGIDNSDAYIRQACDNSLARLGTYIDLFYLHRIDEASQPIEHSMRTMMDLLDAGKIRAVGLSEASADMIDRADRTLRALSHGRHGIAAVQTEYSMMSRNVEYNGVLATCERIGAKLVAYSPISRGLLSGAIRQTSALDADDFRRGLPRFADTALPHNLALVDRIAAVAEHEAISAARLALTWLLHRSPVVLPIPGTKRAAHLDDNVAAATQTLTQETLQQLDAILDGYVVIGERYAPAAMAAYKLSD